MADQIEALKQLQSIDAELHKLRRLLATKPQELEQAKAPLTAADSAVTAAEEQLKKLQTAQKEKEMDLQSREGSVRKLQSQLFQLKTNKEYAAMQREIALLKADNSVLEEAILKGFDAIEEASKLRQQRQAAAAAAQQQFNAAKAQIDRQTQEFQQQIGELEKRRMGMLANVPPKALSIYERILKLRDGLALVPIVKDACGGCNRRLPPQVVNQVYLKADLVHCESCNRILYFDEAHSTL